MRNFVSFPLKSRIASGEWSISIKANFNATTYPRRSSVEVCLKKEMSQAGFIPQRVGYFNFSFKGTGTNADRFTLIVDHKKDFMNLPRGIRGIILRQALGPRRYGVKFEV